MPEKLIRRQRTRRPGADRPPTMLKQDESGLRANISDIRNVPDADLIHGLLLLRELGNSMQQIIEGPAGTKHGAKRISQLFVAAEARRPPLPRYYINGIGFVTDRDYARYVEKRRKGGKDGRTATDHIARGGPKGRPKVQHRVAQSD